MRFTPRDAMPMMCIPVSVWPVKAIFATFGCPVSTSPISAPVPVTRFSAPFGRPASTMSSTQRVVASGVVLAGFRTTVHPDASAGATLFDMSVSGKFQGVIAATTPTGRLMTMPKAPGSASWTYSPRILSARPA